MFGIRDAHDHEGGLFATIQGASHRPRPHLAPTVIHPQNHQRPVYRKVCPGLGAIWLERWKEYRNTEDLSDRFGLLCYLLYTSSGYDLIQERYPKSPPTILELFFGIEQMLAYSAGLQSILNSVENFKKVDAVMPDFDPFDDEDELLGEDDDDL